MEQIYQQIGESLVEMIPEVWEKVLVYAEYREGYKKVFFYYYCNSVTEAVYSLNIPELFEINEDEFDELENDLYGSFTKLWNEFKKQGQEPWSNLTFILENTGKMNIEYGYEDLSGISPIDKQDKWESEYLT